MVLGKKGRAIGVNRLFADSVSGATWVEEYVRLGEVNSQFYLLTDFFRIVPCTTRELERRTQKEACKSNSKCN